MSIRLAAGILIGGESRRMGRPKALLEVDGQTLIERTAALARRFTDNVVLLGRPSFNLPTTLSSMEILPDRHPGAGPIGGLDALLAARADREVLLLACDMPSLSENVLRRIAEGDTEFDAVVPRTSASIGTEPRIHPCAALYRPVVRYALAAAIESREFTMMKLLARLRVRYIDVAGDDARAFDNWNTPEDAASPRARVKDR